MRADIMDQVLAIKASMDIAAKFLTDQQAAKAPRIYPLWKAGMEVAAGDRLYYSKTDRLYKVKGNMGHTTQETWTPDITPAMYDVIDVEHEGTVEDPIPAARGMEYIYGLYYTDAEDGKVYLCERTGAAAGDKIVLQYLPHELVGHYFTEVN